MACLVFLLQRGPAYPRLRLQLQEVVKGIYLQRRSTAFLGLLRQLQEATLMVKGIYLRRGSTALLGLLLQLHEATLVKENYIQRGTAFLGLLRQLQEIQPPKENM